MRLMRYRQIDSTHGEWVQLFSDSALDRFKNLADLTDKKEARKNLELDKYFWNKEELEKGDAVKSIHNICIIQDEKAQFLSQIDRDNWDQKVDRPIVATEEPKKMTEGQMFYEPSSDLLFVKVNGKLRSFENNKAAFGRGAFAGKGKEVTIAHNLTNSGGGKITPKYVSFSCVTNPQGELGETWFRKDDTNIYIGNTGSYTGAFDYMISY